MGKPNLTKAQTFYNYEPTKVDIVGKNKDFISIALLVLFLTIERFDSSKKILIRIIFPEKYTISFGAWEERLFQMFVFLLLTIFDIFGHS